MHRFLAPALLLACSARLCAATAAYEIRYDGGRTLHVEADLPAGDGRLMLRQGGGIDHLPDQWATFVRELVVTSAGEPVQARPAGKEGWTTSSTAPLHLRYDVDLAYAIGRWPAGNEQSGRLFPQPPETTRALYSVTKPLFVYTSAVSEASIRFRVPDRWRIAAPWAETAPSTYRAASLESLVDNSIVVGEFGAVRIAVGDFDVTVATPAASAPAPLLTAALQKMGSQATALFRGTPPGRYVLTFFPDQEEDGESYESSSALTSPSPLDAFGMIVTGNTVIHELLHHWIGGMIAPREHDSLAWFTEGFTEYYANVMLARSGVVAPQLIREKITHQVSGYLYFMNSALFHGVPISAAGEKKGAYRFGVYNGGWAIALSLDVMIRSESEGRRSLDDVMGLLFSRFGRSRAPLSESDVVRAASDVAGRDLAWFFARYVDQRNDLPLHETMARLGFDLRGQPYAADVFLAFDPAAPPAAKQLRSAILGRQ